VTQVCHWSLGLEVIHEDRAYEQQRDKCKLLLFSTFISIIQKPASKSCMHCAKGDFPHAQYGVYLHAIDARPAVKCGIAAVTWCDVTANHRRAAHSIPNFTFRIPHAAVPHFTHSLPNDRHTLLLMRTCSLECG